LKTFKSIYKKIIEQSESISEFIEKIELIPNAKKYRDIIDNITLSYGHDMMFQRGLGTRNLILILTLYSYFIDGGLDGVDKYFNLVCIEELESHLDINNIKLAVEFIEKAKDRNTLTQLILSTHNSHIINKLRMNNITMLLSHDRAVSLENVDSELVYYLAKRENFDTLNLLFAEKLLLVEGATEEIFLNCLLQKKSINNVKVISIGQKGFTTFIEIWNEVHGEGDKLGVIRDNDNQPNAKSNHEKYNSDVVKVATSSGKEFENDIILQGENLGVLNEIFSTKHNSEGMYKLLIKDKLNSILKICHAIEKGESITTPDYIKCVLEWIKT
jgi:predicted ATP-dependent endonuclease of OLD family